ncbi:ribosome-binding factor A [Mycoplasmopsis agassizii]|uniref:Ribosome-binding factor A n=1 Tax=Mycoplasmopsis agassizii TaxID=33922 RepID=A0A269TJZ8_9BACT|nr:30S ribosome-binding factor RbfA [Mycoplasmopsis agassizii]PAK21744.1 ribosome-binding factor A [Mycoplasmopsis agassizii]
MNNIKIAKKQQDLLLNISRIINDEVYKLKDSFTTVNDVRLTPDLMHATIYVSFLDFESTNLERLNSAKGFIRSELAKILPWRKIPALHFKLDEVAKSAERIDEILNNLKK